MGVRVDIKKPIIDIAKQKGKNISSMMMYAGVSVKKPKLYANPAKNELTDAIKEYRIAIMNQLTQ